PRAAGGVSVDGGVGDRRADRVAVLGPAAPHAGGGAAPGIPAAGSGVADVVCGRGDRAERLLVPRYHVPGRVRAGADGEAAAGADDGVRLLAVGIGAADPVPVGGGPVRRVVAADLAAGCGA